MGAGPESYSPTELTHAILVSAAGLTITFANITMLKAESGVFAVTLILTLMSVRPWIQLCQAAQTRHKIQSNWLILTAQISQCRLVETKVLLTLCRRPQLRL